MAIAQVTKTGASKDTISSAWNAYNATVTAILTQHSTAGAHGVITATSLATTTITALTSLTPAGNLDIGAYSFRAQNLIADALTSGRVVLTTTNGQLTSDANITFSVDTLTVAKIGATTLAGAIAGGDQSFTNVGNMTFAAGSILASGSTNTNTLLLKANDTTCITLTTAATDTMDLAAVNSLAAIANIDIGSYNLRAATLTADGLTATRVVFTGTNGLLSDDADITFVTDTLTVAKASIGAAGLTVGATTPSAAQWGMLGAAVEWTAWVPTLTDGADLSGYNNARYFRIGDICFFTFAAEARNVTTAGTIQITLPFTSANTGINSVAITINDGTNYLVPFARITNNTSALSVYKTVAAGGWAGTETAVSIRANGFFEIA